MKNSEELPLKKLIDEMLGAYGLENRLNERKLMNAWEKIVGPMITKHTTQVKFKKGSLIVSLDSSTIRQELDYAGEKLVNELNKEMEQEIVQKLILK